MTVRLLAPSIVLATVLLVSLAAPPAAALDAVWGQGHVADGDCFDADVWLEGHAVEAGDWVFTVAAHRSHVKNCVEVGPHVTVAQFSGAWSVEEGGCLFAEQRGFLCVGAVPEVAIPEFRVALELCIFDFGCGSGAAQINRL